MDIDNQVKVNQKIAKKTGAAKAHRNAALDKVICFSLLLLALFLDINNQYIRNVVLIMSVKLLKIKFKRQ